MRLSSSSLPSALMYFSSTIWSHVSVPVLSVHNMSIAPKFCMALRSFTMVFLRDMATAPFERLAVTIIGSISGVRPTATETAKRNASSQSPFVNPFTRNTKGIITSMKRMSRKLTLLMPLSKAVAARWPVMPLTIEPI